MITYRRKYAPKIYSWIAIGDLHGEIEKLTSMLIKIEKLTQTFDSIIFLGDIISEKSGGGKIITLIKNIKNLNIELIYGNHDIEFLNAYRLIRKSSQKKKQFLQYFEINEEILKWFKLKGIFALETKNCFFSHSGIDDRHSLSNQSIQSLIYSAGRGNLDHVTPKLVIQGHIPMKKVTNCGNHWFLDTGCGYGGNLSALHFPSFEIISV